MTEHCHLDFETRSTCDLPKTGASVYAQDPTTDIWCLDFAFGEEEIENIAFEEDGKGGLAPPANHPGINRIVMHILEGGIFVAHNAAFERLIWKHICVKRFCWPEIPIKKWRCTMAMCYALALPGGLDKAAPAAGIKEEKDAAGSRLMKQMSKPRKLDPLTWWDAPEKKERLYAYCGQDVKVERMLVQVLPALPRNEQMLWFLDQKINDRGMYVDTPLCRAAKKIVKIAQVGFDERIRDVTNFAVPKCSQTGVLAKWVTSRGVKMDSVAKDLVIEVLGRKDIPDDVRQALKTRLASGQTSVSKIDALVRGTDPDGRSRHMLQFYAAGTGRWGGRRFQPQNLKRPSLRKNEIEPLIGAILTGDIDWVNMLYPDTLSAIGDTIRGMVRAAPGNRLVASDYSSIEGRVLAWLAGETTKIKAFENFDAGKGHGIYELTAAGILGKHPSDITEEERQAYGKVPELALGYQGGVGAFNTMAVNYGVDLPDEEVDDIKLGWRAKHLETVQLWYDMNAAAIKAVNNPGVRCYVGEHLSFIKAGTFLYMRLPSGRNLAYANARVGKKMAPWKNNNGHDVYNDAVFYQRVDTYTSKWVEADTYGGKLTENATQAVARDVMVNGMWNVERLNYDIVLHVHDEVVSEVDSDFGSVAEFSEALCQLPPWAAGLPVSADGWEGKRYRK